MAFANDFVYYEDHATEKLPACTIKRQSKLDLNKSDMLQLLSYLEGELQARDIVVAALHAEKVKTLLRKAQKDKKHPKDPILALQRDSDLLQDCSYDESDVKSMYNDQLVKLENLITTQQNCQKKMKDVVSMVQNKYLEVATKLEHDKQLYSRSIANDGNIICALEKERDRLKLELEQETSQAKVLEGELERLKKSQNDPPKSSVDYELIAVQLIKEQTRLMHKLAKLQKLDLSLQEELNVENEKVQQLEKQLKAEEEKLMHEEATQEKQLSEFDFKKQQLMAKLSKAENQHKQLLAELEQLQQPQVQSTATTTAAVSGKDDKSVKQNFKVIPINVHSSSSSTTKTQQQPPQQPEVLQTASHPSQSTKFSLLQQLQQQQQQHQLQQQHRQQIRPPSTTTIQPRIRSPNSNVPIPINNLNNSTISSMNSNTIINTTAPQTTKSVSPQRPQTTSSFRKIVPPGSLRGPPPIPSNKPHIPNLLPQQKFQQNSSAASSISSFKPQLK
ncbi:hypothetical protein HELRODRAFT_163720 [Helobdella robusta]|uniref:Cortactin-binding protein-2 N-terminal domain-containing protein n=1 Tax=Helobdella robusta TaxID=6412 RepID=T1EUE2_HELRO|nr:hypothetical protein HELRODRAFT_163720 [Helobdella robusta]ESN96633.1 hypothetical protein HELRODRAFT_163720 [Helobdella robusta]